MESEATVKKRDTSLDFVKTVSCILIVILHSGTLAPTNAFAFIRAITAVAVPAFMAVTGYLVLYKKQKDYKYILKNSFIRYAMVFMIWWTIYILRSYLGGQGEVSLFYYAFQNAEGWHLWYLFLYLKILLLYPFIRLITNDKQISIAFSFIWLALVPLRFSLGSLLQIDDIFLRWMNLPGFQYDGYIGGTLMGYYPTECLGLFVGGGLLIKTLKEQGEKFRIICYAIGIAGIVSTTIGTIFIIRTVGDNYFDYGLQPLQLNVVMATVGFIAICLYTSSKLEEGKHGKTYARIITSLSEKTLGVYCIHPLVSSLLQQEIEGGGTTKTELFAY